MTYDLASLRTTIKARAKDTSFNDDLITGYMQDVQDEILGRYQLRLVERSTTGLNLDADATDYTPSDAQAILGIDLIPDDNTSSVLQPTYLPYRAFLRRYPTRLVTTSQPCEYTLFGSVILWPAKLDQGYTMTLRYLLASPELADGTTPTIPVEFKKIYILAGLAGIEEYRENFDKAAVYRREIEDLTDDLVSRYQLRQLTAAPKATLGGKVIGGYNGDGAA